MGSFRNLGTKVLYTKVLVMAFLRVLHTIFSTHSLAVGLPGPLGWAFSLFTGRPLAISVGTSAIFGASSFTVPIFFTVSFAVSTFIVFLGFGDGCVFSLCSLALGFQATGVLLFFRVRRVFGRFFSFFCRGGCSVPAS